MDIIDKKKLTTLAKRFMSEAFEANCYLSIIQQYPDNMKKYKDEMMISGAFHVYTQRALVVALIMELSKIYDRHKDSFSIKQLMEMCWQNRAYFPENRESQVNVDGRQETITIPYQHTVATGEDDFFKDEIESHRKLCEALCIENQAPVQAEMSLERYFKFFRWKYKKLKPQLNYLHAQRSKVYAHNDRAVFTNIESTLEENPLHISDISALVDFAVEFSRFAVAMLTGIYSADKPVNINDWEGTLMMAKLGWEYSQKKAEAGF